MNDILIGNAEWSAMPNLYLSIYLSGYLTSIEVSIDEPVYKMYEEKSKQSSECIPYIRPDLMSILNTDKIMRQNLKQILQEVINQSSTTNLNIFRGLIKTQKAQLDQKEQIHIIDLNVNQGNKDHQKISGSHRQINHHSRGNSQKGTKSHSRKLSDIKISIKKDYHPKRDGPDGDGSFDVEDCLFRFVILNQK